MDKKQSLYTSMSLSAINKLYIVTYWSSAEIFYICVSLKYYAIISFMRDVVFTLYFLLLVY